MTAFLTFLGFVAACGYIAALEFALQYRAQHRRAEGLRESLDERDVILRAAGQAIAEGQQQWHEASRIVSDHQRAQAVRARVEFEYSWANEQADAKTYAPPVDPRNVAAWR